MKYVTIKCLILAVSLAISFSFRHTKTRLRSSKYRPPSEIWKGNIEDLKKEFLTQNTAKYISDRGYIKTDYEMNPDRYKVLKANDVLPVGNIYSKDPLPYYPYIDPVKKYETPHVPITPPEVLSRHGSGIYSNDKKPYYGPTSPGDYRYIIENPEGKIHVPIELADLNQIHAGEQNIEKLEKELKDLETGGETLNKLTMGDKYLPDPKPYYDPTTEDTAIKKELLVEKIESLKNNLGDAPEFQEEKVSGKAMKVQNYENKNKEETNEYIGNTYYYPRIIDPNGISVPGNRQEKTKVKEMGEFILEGRDAIKKEMIRDGTIPGIVKNVTKFELPTKNGMEMVEADFIGEVLGDKYVENKTLSTAPLPAPATREKSVSTVPMKNNQPQLTNAKKETKKELAKEREKEDVTADNEDDDEDSNAESQDEKDEDMQIEQELAKEEKKSSDKNIARN